ncbi:hypothetical protein [Methanobacterium formicicum]|uniref:Uncharacterized protein n=1 Tax=Methanobacterium formicicum (strain DSM 3637 / PP1) TaxID=1204725 RepID=K2RT38_METFP|nr:hypothetical protein [Methanobacterium formicicum]EKF85895.1 hypothetical protein A994_05396 [Methanobacterium formicicum DSM 3637]
MNQKILTVTVVLVLAFSALAVLEVSSGFVSGLVFDQIPYNYSAKVWIPPTNASNPNSASMGGFYKINGKGTNFNFFLKISGAEKSESPLDYTGDGLTGVGKIDQIKLTPGTIYAIVTKDIKGAMFNTTFKGHMNLTCAAWTGVTYFQNDGKNFTGNFTIDGVMTDWEGNYTLKRESYRILGISDFIYYPNNQRSAAKNAQKTYYL